jgi:hypothetical protein
MSRRISEQGTYCELNIRETKQKTQIDQPETHSNPSAIEQQLIVVKFINQQSSILQLPSHCSRDGWNYSPASNEPRINRAKRVTTYFSQLFAECNDHHRSMLTRCRRDLHTAADCKWWSQRHHPMQPTIKIREIASHQYTHQTNPNSPHNSNSSASAPITILIPNDKHLFNLSIAPHNNRLHQKIYSLPTENPIETPHKLGQPRHIACCRPKKQSLQTNQPLHNHWWAPTKILGITYQTNSYQQHQRYHQQQITPRKWSTAIKME